MTTPPDVKRLMERSRKVAKGLSITPKEALSLITRQSSEMADELGLSVNTRRLYKREAKRLGIPQGELSDKDKQDAYIKAILKQAKKRP